MKRIKRNKFLTFIASLMPGAAEMFMGLMRQGFSIMAIFFVAIFLPAFLRLGDMFVLIPALVWFYGFFHANMLNSYTQEELDSLQDAFLWQEVPGLKDIRPKVGKWAAVALILAGCVLLWNGLRFLLFQLAYRFFIPEAVSILEEVSSMVPRLVVAIFVIICGVKLMKGSKATVQAVVPAQEENGNGTEK